LGQCGTKLNNGIGKKIQSGVKMHQHLRVARKLALRSNYNFRLGAVLIRGGSVISTGWNSVDHPEAPLYSEHAEESVLRKARYRAEGGTLLVVRIRRDGGLAMAYPCDRCMRLIRSLKVKTVVYSTQEEEIAMKRIRY
jgi:pyrimidine deaminase RibD-like protein